MLDDFICGHYLVSPRESPFFYLGNKFNYYFNLFPIVYVMPPPVENVRNHDKLEELNDADDY